MTSTGYRARRPIPAPIPLRMEGAGFAVRIGARRRPMERLTRFFFRQDPSLVYILVCKGIQPAANNRTCCHNLLPAIHLQRWVRLEKSCLAVVCKVVDRLQAAIHAGLLNQPSCCESRAENSAKVSVYARLFLDSWRFARRVEGRPLGRQCANVLPTLVSVQQLRYLAGRLIR